VAVRARSPRPRHTHVRHRVDLGAQLHAILHRRGVQRQEGDAADAGVAKRAAGHGHGRAQGGRALRESAAEAARAADHKYVFARQRRALRRLAQRHDLQGSARLAEHGLEEVRKRVSRARGCSYDRIARGVARGETLTNQKNARVEGYLLARNEKRNTRGAEKVRVWTNNITRTFARMSRFRALNATHKPCHNAHRVRAARARRSIQLVLGEFTKHLCFKLVSCSAGQEWGSCLGRTLGG